MQVNNNAQIFENEIQIFDGVFIRLNILQGTFLTKLYKFSIRYINYLFDLSILISYQSCYYPKKNYKKFNGLFKKHKKLLSIRVVYITSLHTNPHHPKTNPTSQTGAPSIFNPIHLSVVPSSY